MARSGLVVTAATTAVRQSTSMPSTVHVRASHSHSAARTTGASCGFDSVMMVSEAAPQAQHVNDGLVNHKVESRRHTVDLSNGLASLVESLVGRQEVWVE